MKRLSILCLFALGCGGVCRMACAESLGVVGPTYPIAEEHLLKMIEARLRAKEQSGELARIQEQIVSRGKQSVLAPPPLQLPVVTMPRTFYVDPTYVLDRNIADGSGRMLFAAGTRANPLDIVSMSRRLFFFDGRDERQVALAERLAKGESARIKPVLVGGSYLDLMRRWKIPVYFDQRGVLVKRLRIERVPAMVSQEGRRLRVDELVPAS
ncbi:type-F conjugative transfer system protein TraW [Pseudoduganella eburnea]|uniref:Type-F conjugative transfer system protein TraW n=1 Tax=Massilia eburnea TaxID=1776165 RepID=A0A6L6QCB6_9BURK|nr:type-F conjugative transfer system protein TraW [Massilia eburnea]MTW10158.1 type-F conjugative transfer system protein TraW [Massilia eburnea]